MSALNDTRSVLDLLRTRKSASAKAMTGPGPSGAELEDIFRCAVRVPDHGKLAPWRFILWEGEARAQFGAALRKRWQALNPDHGPEALAFAENLFLRAPVVIGVVSAAAPHPKIPVWEQQLSAGAVCMNILYAATALGYACQWNTDWVAYDEGMAAVMDLKPHEKLAGLIYVGKAAAPLEDRPRPDPLALVTRWRPQ
jgi:nitroreductase